MKHIEERIERPFRARRFVIEEEEDLLVRCVRDTWHRHPAADVASDLFVIERHFGSRQRIEWNRVPFAVATESVQRAVELLAAASCRRRDQDAGVAAELRVERRVLELEFADRVETQLRVLSVVRAGIRVRRAVEHDVVHALSEAVDHEAFCAVEGESESRVVGRHAGQRFEQRREVAPVEAQLSNLRIRDRVRLLTRADFDDWRRRDDIDGLRQRPDRQLHLAQIEHLTRIENQATALERLESGDLRADRVSATEQRDEIEEPVGARRDLSRDDALLLVERRDLRAGQHAALFVEDLALDLRALRPAGRGHHPGRGECAAQKWNACHRCLPERGSSGIVIDAWKGPATGPMVIPVFATAD